MATELAHPPGKLAVAIAAACVLALADWPYGYYQFLRIAATGYCVWVAWWAARSGSEAWTWIFAVLAILYNPVFKISMSRDVHGVINIVTAVLALVELRAHRRADAPTHN